MPFLSSWAATTTRALFPKCCGLPGLYATHIGFIYFDLTGKAVTAWAAPSRDRACAAKPKPSGNCPVPGNAAGPRH